MRILQINTVHQVKSTGRTCLEVEKALVKAGHQCITAYGNGPANMGENAYRIDSRAEYLFHNIASAITGLEGYFSYFATKRLIKFIKEYNPDVIHLRNLHGHYLNLPMFFKFLSDADIPVVQNLHDCWAYTGGCCYYTTIDCNRWQCDDCGKGCPRDTTYPKSYIFNWSKKCLRDKKKWYSSLKNLTVVGVSKWVSDEAKKSFFNGNATITYIYNWINQDVFHPYEDNAETRKKYGIGIDKFIIIGVSSQWGTDSPRYQDFKKLSESLTDNQQLVMVGKMEQDAVPVNVVHIPFVSDTKELAKLYSCADAYVHCSIEDTFGKVIAEAMACGTPAVVYDITACSEIIGEYGGFFVEPRNVAHVIKCLAGIQGVGKEKFSDSCVDWVRRNFSYDSNTKELITLYENMCKKQMSTEVNY